MSGPRRSPPASRGALAVLAAVTLACGATPRATPATAVVTIPHGLSVAPERLAADVAALADDSLRGRETGTADANRAAFLIGRRLARLGLEPMGDTMYYQRYRWSAG